MIKINRRVFILSLAAAMISTHSVYGAAYWLPEYPDKGFNVYSEGSGGGGFVYSPTQECHDNGYTIKSCPDGSHPVNKCPYGLDTGLYKECFSNSAACTSEGYVLSCPEGEEPDLTKYCNHDNLYIKCKCALCLGYDYTEVEANSLGYVQDGEPCNSCGTLKYKRKNAPCEGYNYDTSNCGVDACETLGGVACQSGNILKYKECTACPPPTHSVIPTERSERRNLAKVDEIIKEKENEECHEIKNRSRPDSSGFLRTRQCCRSFGSNLCHSADLRLFGL